MKRTLVFFSLFFFALALPAQSPAYAWTVGFTGSMGESCRKVAIDASGRTAVAGLVNDTLMQFGSYVLTQPLGWPGTVVACLDNSGTVLWARLFQRARTNTILCDGSNFYIAGTFTDSASFDTVHIYGHQLSDAFIAKLDASGNCLWAKDIGGYFDEEVASMCIDANGVIVLDGFFSSDTLFAGNTYLLHNADHGTDCIFVARCSAQGNLLWMDAPAGKGRAYDVCAGQPGEFYITGYASGDVTFGSHTYYSHGGADAFLAKYDDAGNVQWVAGGGGTMPDQGACVATDPAGNVYLAGDYFDSAYFGTLNLPQSTANSLDIFLAKYTPGGNLIWVTAAGGKGVDYPKAIGINSGYQVYLGGYFTDTIGFGATTLNDMSGTGFLAQFSAYGNPQWAMIVGSGTAQPQGLSVSASGDVILGGYFTGAVEGFGSDSLNNSSVDSDGFVTLLSTFTGITENPTEESIHAFPNPYTSVLSLFVPGTTTARVCIYDSQGRLQFTREMPTGQQTLNLGALSCGVYTIRIFSEDNVFSQKLVHMQ